LKDNVIYIKDYLKEKSELTEKDMDNFAEFLKNIKVEDIPMPYNEE